MNSIDDLFLKWCCEVNSIIILLIDLSTQKQIAGDSFTLRIQTAHLITQKTETDVNTSSLSVQLSLVQIPFPLISRVEIWKLRPQYIYP